MIRWIPYTFIRTTFFLICGIVLAIYFPHAIRIELTIVVLVFLLLLYMLIFFLQKKGQSMWFNPGLTGLTIVFFAGYVHVRCQTGADGEKHLFRYNPVAFYEVRVESYAEEKEKTWKVSGKILAVKMENWMSAEGKVVLYFPKRDFEKPFNYGDVLLIKGSPSEVPPPGNPGEFDYKTFLTYRRIYHQHFAQKENVRWLRQEVPNQLLYYALQARLWANGVLHKNIDGDQERAVASALILGVTDGLDPELLYAYSATGAMHVLAVSGLHVSIIFLIILFIFKPVTKTKQGKATVVALSLIFLWGYAFVTGLSPSVLRAVTMFSFFAIAKIAARNTNIYNTLAASAFCLLLFDPFLIMSVGFQLSYLAVLGILYIQPMLQRAFEPRSWLANEIWKITSVSIAAQISTLSVALFYFHQFPNYFLLSNLLVIPLSFGVLILGLLILAVSFIQAAAALVGFCLEIVIRLLNYSVIGVEWLPFSVIENIHITALQAWLLTLIVICLILIVQRRGFVFVKCAVFFTILFGVADWIVVHEKVRSPNLFVYKVSGHTAIDFTSDGKVWFVGSEKLALDRRKVSFHLRPNRIIVGAAAFPSKPLPSLDVTGGKMFVWCGQSVLLLTDKVFPPIEIESPDIIIIANDALEPSLIVRFPKSTRLVFDGSNSPAYLKKVLKAPSKAPVHSVLDHGAFQLT
jgi:competence protein ComEC